MKELDDIDMEQITLRVFSEYFHLPDGFANKFCDKYGIASKEAKQLNKLMRDIHKVHQQFDTYAKTLIED